MKQLHNSIAFGLFALCLILIHPTVTTAQGAGELSKIDQEIKDATEKREDARYAKEDAEKAVKARIEALKKAADEKDHGNDAELDRLRKEQTKAEKEYEAKDSEVSWLKAKKATAEAEATEKASRAERPIDRDKVKSAKEDLKRAKAAESAWKAVKDAARAVADEHKKPKPNLPDLDKKLKDAKDKLKRVAAENAYAEAEKAVEAEKARRPRDNKALEEAEKKMKDAKAHLEKILEEQINIPEDDGLFVQDKDRFLINFNPVLPLGNPKPISLEHEILQENFMDPAFMEALFEKLDGESMIGSFPSEATTAYPMEGSTQLMPGLALGANLGKGFEIQAQAHYFQNKWTGSFPVTVFPDSQGSSNAPYTTQGSINASAKAWMTALHLNYLFNTGAIQPYISAGLRAQFKTTISGHADIAGVSIPLDFDPIESSFSPVVGTGVRANFWGAAFAELGCAFGKIPGAGYKPSLGLGFGLKF